MGNLSARAQLQEERETLRIVGSVIRRLYSGRLPADELEEMVVGVCAERWHRWRADRNASRASFLVVCVQNELRTRFRFGPPETLPLEPDLAGAVQDAESLALAALEAAELRAHLRRLPPRDRDILESSFFRGEAHGLIAARYGLQRPAITKAGLKALKRLRGWIEAG